MPKRSRTVTISPSRKRVMSSNKNQTRTSDTSSSTKSSSSSHTSAPQARLANISAHMAPDVLSAFPANAVPQAPEDPLFGLMAAFRKDTFDKKVDLGIGAYRDNNAKPWVLPVVHKVSRNDQYQLAALLIIPCLQRPTLSFEMIHY
jgi:aspartate aminotransferase